MQRPLQLQVRQRVPRVLLERGGGDFHQRPASPIPGTSVIPASTSATWRLSTAEPSRFSFPAMLRRHPRSAERTVPAPVAAIAAVFLSAMAFEMSGYLMQ